MGRWLAGALLTLVCCVGQVHAAKAPPSPDNLIILSIDTLRADRLSCYGNPRPTSPTLDSIAAEGVIFDDASATSPWTKPSHASLLTGLYPSRNGVVAMNSVMAPNVVHLASWLRNHGFHTAAVVNSGFLKTDGLERGFNDFRSIDYVQGRREGSNVVEAVIASLERRPPGRLFGFFHFMDVHSDYTSLPRYERLFAESYDGPFTGATSQLYRVAEGTLTPSARDIAHLKNLYDASIRQLDDELARLFLYLRQKGLLDRTLVVIVSDHGEEFLDHGSVLHGWTQHQEVVRIPMILRGPGIPRNKRLTPPVSLVDVMPTSLELLGVPVPPDLDGVALRRLWSKPAGRLDSRVIYFEADVTFPPPGPGPAPVGSRRAARSDRFKLHLDTSTRRTRLYDLSVDPLEQREVSAEHAEMTAALRARLEQFLRRQQPAAEVRQLTEDELERLRSLGYVK